MTSKRKQFSVAEKLDIIRRMDSGEKNGSLAKEFGVNHSTISTIYKNKYELSKCLDSNSTKKKRIRLSTMEDLEICLLKWFKQQRNSNVPINGPILKAKAEEFAKKLEIDKDISPGWVQRFRGRHKIVFGKLSGERGDVSEEVCVSWLQDVWPTLCGKYPAENIYNADEMGLFFNLTPSVSFKFKGEKCSNGKLSKDRLTVMVAANMTGTSKNKLLVIGKSKHPRCFKNIRLLPVDYESNSKAWMTSAIFEKWLFEWDRLLTNEGRQICLVVDNCPAHPHVKGLKSIELIFLPPNVTSVLQPMDQGVIKSLKSYYRNRQVSKMLLDLENGAEKYSKVNVLEAILILTNAWNDVKPTTIENCFRHAGFVSGPIQVPENNTPLLPPNLLQQPQMLQSIEDLVEIDNNLIVCEELTDDDILSSLATAEKTVEPDDSNNEAEFECPSVAKACEAVGVLQKFVCMNDFPNNEAIYTSLSSLSNVLYDKFCNSNCNIQSKITDYFF